ncbi:DEAD/DEAH box helicase [Nanoarchaeota archaeon]
MEFKDLNLIKQLLEAVRKEGYTIPTPIQEKTIPLLLKGKDVIGIAQTGTGKTAAFALPILQKLYEKPIRNRPGSPRTLILAPTRELAAQISESFGTYGNFMELKHLVVYGGVGITPQIRALQRGIDVLIATPGRLIDLMDRKEVSLKNIKFLVLDEADRMLDMGFLRDVDKIISATPNNRQGLFFSATMSKEVSSLARRFLKEPVRVEITPESTAVEAIDQYVFFIDRGNKNELLLDLIIQEKIDCAIVFVAGKYKADKIARMLKRNGVGADAIHGNKNQNQRTNALRDFKRGKVKVLVATDIAARGIDVENITHVINYDLPNEPGNYIHRIGRTGRAGMTGKAYSFCASEDRNYLNEIEKLTKKITPQAEHKNHSIKAKNAKGEAAKPKPRSGRGGQSRGPPRRGGSYGGRDSSRGRSYGGRSRSSSRGRSYGNRDGRSSSRTSSNSRSGFSGRSYGGRSRSSGRR